MGTTATVDSRLAYSFTQEDAQRAFDEWGANCGPGALACCLGLTLDQVRPAMDAVDFPARKYTNPTMMENAIAALGTRIRCRLNTRGVFPPGNLARCGLVRAQWHGPWTEPGANPKWAYRYTHWIHTRLLDKAWWVFDINAGWAELENWSNDTVPLLTGQIPRANGVFSVTHSWEVVPCHQA